MEALTALPGHTRNAYIRPGLPYALGIMSLDDALPLPALKEVDVRANCHLLDQYVPDAHGVQVLSGAHLDKAHDLSRWDVKHLGHDRYLVSAHDLERWYGDGPLDIDVIDQACRDFGIMILSAEAIQKQPPPWRQP